jgi:hypothetical protein
VQADIFFPKKPRSRVAIFFLLQYTKIYQICAIYTIYTIYGKYTKLPQYIPNGHKIYEMDVK